MRVCLALLLLSTACEGEVIPPRDDDDDNSIDCSEPIRIDMAYEGVVQDADGPVAGAEVRLVDVAPQRPEQYGLATTAANGTFRLEATNVQWFADCHLVFTDYTLRAELDGKAGEDDVNFETFRALDESRTTVVLSAPIELETP